MKNSIAIIVLALALAFTSYLSVTKKPIDFAEDLMMAKQESILQISHKMGMGTVFVMKTKSGKKVGITNNHVCHKFKKFTLTPREGGVTYKSQLIANYAFHDLCMVTVPQNLPALNLGDVALIDEPLYTAGFAGMPAMSSSRGYLRMTMTVPEGDFNIPVKICQGKVEDIPDRTHEGKLIKDKKGKVKLKKACLVTATMIFTSIPVTYGASGSPILNEAGEVVGVVMAMQGTLSHCIGVPLENLKNFLDQH